MAEFTGTYENGLPVYRLPPIEITARRGANQAAQRTERPDRRRRNVTLTAVRYHAIHLATSDS